MERLKSTHEEKIEALRHNRYFENIDDDILEELTGNMTLYRYERGEFLFFEGEPCAGLFILQEGSVKLYKLSPQGRELIIRVLQQGETFNEVPVFDGKENAVNVSVLEESRIWNIEAEALRNMLRRHPDMAQSIILNLSKNLRMLVEMVEELSFFQVTTRLARLIISLSDEELAGSRNYRLTQDEMAARLGTVREVVARSLRELERSGAIQTYRGRIEILDEALLVEWAHLVRVV